MKSILMANLQSMDYLPTMERWFLTRHVDETLRTVGASLDRYFSYRAVPMPEGENPADWGYYNWRVIELWWHTSPIDLPPQGVAESAGAPWPPEYDAYLGGPGTEASAGRREPLRPISGFLSRRFTNDFKGAGRTLDDGHNLRWVVAHKYPAGVDVEVADDWWVNVHATEMCEQPELKRFFSTRFTGAASGDMVRLSELWFERGSAWRDTVNSSGKFTRPAWASRETYPFLRPYEEFASTFLLEVPTNDFKRCRSDERPRPPYSFL